MGDLLYSVLSFVVAIGILVTVHEYGHFWVARRLGVKVLRFSVGFGRPLWRWRRSPDATEYVVAIVPLGGYVKMLDEREGEVAPADRPRAFNRQSLVVRSAVVLAGPAFNFLFAVVAYWAMFSIGVSGLKPLVAEVTPGSLAARAGLQAGQQIVAVDGDETRTWESVIQRIVGRALERGAVELEVRDEDRRRSRHRLPLDRVVLDDLTGGKALQALGIRPQRPILPAVIGRVVEGGAAARAGLVAGDRVLAADGAPIRDWGEWVRVVRARPDRTMLVEIDGGTGRRMVELRPEAVVEGDRTIGRIGAAVRDPDTALERFYAAERYPPAEALGRAIDSTYAVSALTLRMFWKMLRLEVSVKNLSGPISIAQYAGYSARGGVSRFLEFLAIVSVSLGILNLLPIPLLDGGHLMYYLVELFKGGPVSEGAQLIGQQIGIALLVGLMGLAFYNDLARLFG